MYLVKRTEIVVSDGCYSSKAPGEVPDSDVPNQPYYLTGPVSAPSGPRISTALGGGIADRKNVLPH